MLFTRNHVENGTDSRLVTRKMLYLRFSGEACIAVHQKWIENIL